LHPLVGDGTGHVGPYRVKRLLRQGCDVGSHDKHSTGHRFSSRASAPWSRHKRVTHKSMAVFTGALQGFRVQGMKAGHDNLTLTPKQASYGSASANAGRRGLSTLKRTRTRVAP
jgi:hypothetical protein